MSSNSPYDPEGPVSVVGIASSGKPANSVGVSTVVICEDSKGNKFSLTAAYFVNELRPYNPDQGMDFSTWDRKRGDHISAHPNRWRYEYNHASWARSMKDYMTGVAYDNVPELNS